MPPEWSLVKRLLGEALERPAPERSSWISRACAGDEALQAEVATLVAAHERAGDFLATGPSVAAEGDGRIGTRLGAYVVTGLLGHGGMGVVYRARREQPEREVAVKVVSGVLSSQARRRFEEESRIVGVLRDVFSPDFEAIHVNQAEAFAQGALAVSLAFPLLLLYTDSAQLGVVAGAFYAFSGGVVMAYIGFATYEDVATDKTQKGAP